ncbi:MAG TPA: NAD-dependent epimerase/dehydratase family protein [Thermoplasmata archaeon]|jgi:UDP-glucose 4-epimerase|nr:NAD-dependent epimerase/dehydratase family protein [Thermoplasmata archaeon]
MANAAVEGPVVVTGGAGAIGSVLVRSLLDRASEVRVIDNLSSGRREHLVASRSGQEAHLTVADLKEPSSYASTFRGARVVWHLATNPDIRKGLREPGLDLEEGTRTTFHVLEAMRQHDVPKVVFSSSSVVYGHPTVLPTPEEYGPLQPESLYGAAKLAAEGLLSAYAHSYGMSVHIFRFANIIGPNMTHGILPDFFEKLRRDPTRLEVLGDGRQSKSYLRTEDCVEGMLLATERAHDRVNLFNLGNVDQISAREIGEKVALAHGGRARIECTGGVRGWAGDVPVQLLSIRKIEGLGWKPRWNSSEAVDHTIEEMMGKGPGGPGGGRRF